MPKNGLSIRGISGPNGEQPRFYCRRKERQGTIPKGVRTEAMLVLGQGGDYLVENIHIDGYQSSIKLPPVGHIVLRNNYMHHAFSNGLIYSNTSSKKTLDLEVCGNEVSHSGRGNSEHGFYLHRNLSKIGSANVTLVDNVCHSTPYSSCYKSIRH